MRCNSEEPVHHRRRYRIIQDVDYFIQPYLSERKVFAVVNSDECQVLLIRVPVVYPECGTPAVEIIMIHALHETSPQQEDENLFFCVRISAGAQRHGVARATHFNPFPGKGTFLTADLSVCLGNSPMIWSSIAEVTVSVLETGPVLSAVPCQILSTLPFATNSR